MAASSSSDFFCMRHENEIRLQQQPIMPSAPPPPPPPPPPSNKKRRNQPGNPNPDAEVIALSPTSLMATNRFVCEVCKKGFQREQNLQLHRRGHNLPWKLKQKKTKEATRRKVYLCPEPGCVHHHPSRALGDLTGIKKHYSRKHGEKKYKCERCARKYAVKSDWKAHSKTCGTREYRCDCGTLFSRRDSFITHRAFCDALAQESTRNINPPHSFSSISTHLLGLSQSNHHLSDHHQPPLSSQDLLRFGGRPTSQFETLVGPGFSPSLSHDMGPTAGLFLHQQVSSHDGNQTDPHGLLGLINNVVNCSSSSTSGVYNLGFFPGSNAASGMDVGHLMSMEIPSLYSTTSSNAVQTAVAHMSATALLQKAAQLGPTTSSNAAPSSLLKSLSKSSANGVHHHPPLDAHSSGVLGDRNPSNNNNQHMQDLINSMASGASSASIFGGLYDDDHDEYRRFHAFDDGNHGHNGNYENLSAGGTMSGLEQGGSFTRDFLGVGGIAREQYNVMEMSALDHSISMQEKTSDASHHSLL